MLTFLVAVLAACVGALAVGALYARSDRADLDTLQQKWDGVLEEHEQRITRCEQEQAQRDLLVADACSKITVASKRIQTRLKEPESTPARPNGAGESVLDMRNRLHR